MSSTHQWRTSLVSNFMLIVAALAATLALAPAASFAHPGHDHGLSSATGRVPGMPDYQKIKGVVIRFNARSREYIVEKPGTPPVSAHIEVDAHPAAEGMAANGGYSPLPSAESQPACATSGHRFVVVRAYDEGTKTPDTEDALIRSLVKRMNWKFMQQSQLSSEPDRTLQMKVNCDGSGAITVQDVAVPFGYIGEGVDTTDGKINEYDTMRYVEEKLGEPEGPNAVKYLIFIDKDLSSFVGVGYGWPDPAKNSNNLNLNYTASAVVDRGPKHTNDGKDSWESTIPIHEALHTMGASINGEFEGKPVPVPAPYSSSNRHCVDGIDILCYADQGTSPEGLSYSETRCPADAGHESAERVTMDCKFDTYFDAEAEPGEWLSQWWNVGGSENPFLVYTPGVPPVTTAPAVFTKPADFETYSATLKGIVNPGGVSTTYKFEYGTTISYGSSIPVSPESIGSGIEDVEVSETIKTEPGVTYHYRIVATNSKGTFYGEDKTVKTSAWGIQAIQGPSSSGGRGQLFDVSCSSSIHCVAVGSNTKGATLAERWDGSQWSIMTTANPVGESSLGSVSCSSSSFCMATGANGGALLSEYWDGSKWSLASMPVPSGGKNLSINDISCTSSTSCIAVGRYAGSKGIILESKTLTERWNGSEWIIDPSPNVEGNAFSQLSGLSCTSSTSCLAVGKTTKELGGAPVPLVEKWDGSKWSIQSAPIPPGGSGYLIDLSCPTVGFCMVSGSAEGGGGSFTSSWNGTSWQAQASGLPQSLGSISCATQTSCELIGGTTGRHWNGSEWTVQDLAQPSGATQASLVRLSCPQQSQCTAVGSYPGVPFFSPGTRPLAERLTPTPHVKLRAEEYPTQITSVQSGEHKLETKKGNVRCKNATATGIMTESSSTLTLTPAYSSCIMYSSSNVKVSINSCQYVLQSTNGSIPYTGSIEIVCSKAGDGIEFTMPGICTIKLPQQTALGTVSLANTGKKSRGRTITASLTLTGVKYTEIPILSCPSPGTHETGTYTGTSVFSGYNPTAEHPVGVYLANEQVVVPPLIESEKYTAVVDAVLPKGSMSISMPGEGMPISFTCSSIGKGQGLLNGASTELNLKFKKWTGCTWSGGFTVNMNGCSFVLRPLIGELPYTSGSMDITCPKGAVITFSLVNGGCEVSIPAQSGLSVVKTENIGSGATRAVEVSLAVKGMTYTQNEKVLCNNPGTHNDGIMSGTWNLKGYQFAGEQMVEGQIEYLEGEQKGIWVE